MLNKKKQIVLLDNVLRSKNSMGFNLPEYTKNSYVQTVDNDDQSLDFLNFIIEKPIFKALNKKFISKALTKKFRYFFLNNVFKRYVLFKIFYKKIKKNKNKVKPFSLLFQHFINKKNYPLAFQKIKKGGFKTLFLGFQSFMPKSLSLKTTSPFKKHSILSIKLIRRNRRFFPGQFGKLNIVTSSKKKI
jgi:hypothetical protein